MFGIFLQRLKSLLVQKDGIEDAYGGYTPSKVRSQPAQTFDQAIKAAPIRDEWIDENYWGYLWHTVKNISGREWFGGAAFVALMFLLFLFMPSS